MRDAVPGLMMLCSFVGGNDCGCQAYTVGFNSERHQVEINIEFSGLRFPLDVIFFFTSKSIQSKNISV